MIFREATEADIDALDVFLKRELAAWGFEERVVALSTHVLMNRGRRRFVLGLEGKKIVAVGTITPIKMDIGPTAEVPLLLVAFNHPDWRKTMDDLCLFIVELLAPEGIVFMVSRQDDHTHVADLYDRYGFSPFVAKGEYRWTTIKRITSAILRERARWQT